MKYIRKLYVPRYTSPQFPGTRLAEYERAQFQMPQRDKIIHPTGIRGFHVFNEDYELYMERMRDVLQEQCTGSVDEDGYSNRQGFPTNYDGLLYAAGHPAA